MPELPKAYEPRKYEDEIYERWQKSGFFNPDNLEGEPFSILFPPPNVTGVLHLGHALENSLMDVMARYQRMNGKKVLLLPGTDHAAVATQAKVEKELIKQGIKKPREEFGREELLNKIRDYAEKSKSTIISQIKSMGTSCDWSRLAYTFDDQRSRAVNEVFLRMYNHGLIYRGYRVVNWSVKGQSTCSDDELVYVERPAKLYTFKYSKEFPFSIATTRPETKLGDTAVAVNPKDERYGKYVGKIFKADVGAKNLLEIKIISDENVDPAFGTGALGVTPAHSAVDFAMYEKMKAAGDPINLIPIIGIDGKMTEAAGIEYEGLKAEEAREKFVAWLRDNDLLEKEEDITQSVGTSDRFADVVEALPLTQWFVDVNKKVPGREKSLKDLMKEAVSVGHNGDPEQKVHITPERFEKIYFNWIDNLRDWCISRQIWWGHRIPVWYKKGSNEIFAGVEAPKDGEWQQDPDTLDTWFSSGMWTFSTLGWPDNLTDFEKFHPTSWMQMGYEILFFWMARMILMTTYTVDQIPFKNVYIHGMVRDEHGKKYSKSADNGVDPVEMINIYGCDALRLCLLSGIAPGNDTRFYKEKIEGWRNFANKFWNISRFMLINIKNPARDIKRPTGKTMADKWILNRLDEVIKQTGQDMEKYNFSLAGETMRDFTWSDLADWYLEIAKIEGDKEEIYNYILNTILKLWHPHMPFVTETIWQEIYGKDSFLMIQKWPVSSVDESQNLRQNVADFEMIKNLIVSVRALRVDYKIEPVKKLNALIGAGGAMSLMTENFGIIKYLARLEELEIKEIATKPENWIGCVSGSLEIFIDVSAVVDLVKEKARIEKEIKEANRYVDVMGKKLSNQEFINNAPAEVVEKERAKLNEAKEKVEKLAKQFENLK